MNWTFNQNDNWELKKILVLNTAITDNTDSISYFFLWFKEMDDSPIPASSPESGEASQQSDRSEKRLMRLAEFLQKKRNQFKVDDSMARN